MKLSVSDAAQILKVDKRMAVHFNEYMSSIAHQSTGIQKEYLDAEIRVTTKRTSTVDKK